MDNYLFKLRFLFVPMVAFSVVVSLGYLAAYGVLVEWTGWIAAEGELQELWLPLIVAGVAAIAFLGPRLRVYDTTGTRDPGGFVVFVAMLLIVPSVIFLQYSLQEAMWGMRTVPSLNDVPIDSNARFYTTKGDCVTLPGTRWHNFAHSDGRHNDVEFEVYAAVPVCANGGEPTRWIGVHRSLTVSGSKSQDDVAAEANTFEQKVRADIDSLEALRFSYYERVRAGSDRHQFEKAIGKSGVDIVIVTPRHDAFGARTTDRLFWAAGAFVGGAVLFAFVLLFGTLNEDEVESVRKTGKLTERPKEEFSLWNLVVPSRRVYGPAALFDVIVGVYAAMVFSGLGVTSFATDDLLEWGANHGPFGFGPGHLGLITAMFLHAGLWHMVNNLYGLVFAVICLMPAARNGRLILCFLICGVMGSVASVWWNPQVVGVGASGAVLGLWGVAAALALLRDRRVAGNERFILLNIAIYGGMTALLGFASRNVDNAAHVGGFITGLAIGVALFVWEKVSPDPELDDEHRGLAKKIFKSSETPAR